MTNQVNPTYLKDDEKISKKVLKEIRQEQQQLILDLTEQQIVDKFSDKNLDRENEKIKLISGAEISISGFKAYINEMVQQYSPVFPKEFYREIFRLMGWNISESELYLKPPIVGRYTNDIIYGRFPREILPTLQILNPYIRIGMRAVKHFQWFTDNGQQKLKVIIQEAINEMKESNNWYEFRAKYARKYGVPFQLSLFTENNIII